VVDDAQELAELLNTTHGSAEVFLAGDRARAAQALVAAVDHRVARPTASRADAATTVSLEDLAQVLHIVFNDLRFVRSRQPFVLLFTLRHFKRRRNRGTNRVN